jgi:hypothetical protein
MVASSVESWGIIPTTVPSMGCRLPIKVMDRGLDNHLLRFTPGTLLPKATELNRTTCMVS